MEAKWFAIMMVGMMGAGMFGLGMKDYHESNLAIESAKAGLEECPNLNSINSYETIWVKDCKVYTEIFHATKDKK